MRLSYRIPVLIAGLVCLVALLAACGDQSATPVPADEGPGSTQTEPAAPTALPSGAGTVSPLPTPTDAAGTEPDQAPTGPVPIEITLPASAPLTGEVPQELLDAVFDDLAERLGASWEAIVVEEAGAVIWRDGSLGCPQPDMMYTQALVPGYRIVLNVGEETYDYHASQSGYFLLCEEGMAEEPLPPDGGAPLDK